jgi:hypothetical protein
MTLIVEDGTGLANAESYISVTDADTYHDRRGNTLWSTMNVTERENCLRRATEFMVGFYGERWKGDKKLGTQALDWPRYNVWLEARIPVLVSDTNIPRVVGNACAELAFRAASGPLSDDQTRGVLEEAVGPIKIKYDPLSPQQARYPYVTLILASYLRSSGGATVKLVRT